MQELSGGAPAGNGQAPQRIEAGPGGFENANNDGYGDGDRDLKPWQRGPTGAAAPWQRAGGDQGGRGDYGAQDGGSAPPWAAGGRGGDGYGYGQPSYGAPPPGPPGGAAPWHQQGAPPPGPPGGLPGYGGYSGYPGYGDATGGYPSQPSMGAPPGLGGGAGGLGAPPGLGALFQTYNGNGTSGSPPPPPPPGDAPPPPVSPEFYSVSSHHLALTTASTATQRFAPTTTSPGSLINGASLPFRPIAAIENDLGPPSPNQ